KRQIARFGEITGATQKAQARIGEIETALVELRKAAGAQRLRVLPYARRGWVSGGDSLMGDLLREAGLSNAAQEIGLKAGGFVRLEQLVALKPDALMMSRDDGAAEDQGKAMLLHPSIAALYPPERRLFISERLTNCGGPALVGAIRELTREVARLAGLPNR
ncbi:MAG: ABC transporter substrate-binding protein, partial [Bosea sp. (in: a-proteobacteria)]